MAEPKKDDHPHEIVIVRRHNGGDHDEPHGGVWKVAFADFMTAMMAFFLVLWIVNSTSKETRSSVARYFNPVRLSDTTPARKGLKDPNEGDFDAQGELHPEKEMAKNGHGAAAESPPPAAEHAPKSHGEKAPPPSMGVASAKSKDSPVPETREHKANIEVATNKRATESLDDYRDPFERPQVVEPAKDKAAPSADPSAQRVQEAQSLSAELAKSLGQEEIAKLGSALEVKADAEGLLISLTDRSDFGMFAIGSAEPEGRLVRTLSAVAQALRAHSGDIIIRGHTDSRPYRGATSDNWQLSSARAQAAYYLLLHDGVEDKRVERIEGYADHRLKTPNAPEAPENRRIEILLRKAAS